MINADAKKYEEMLLTLEKVNALQVRLGISEMGRDTTKGFVVVSSNGMDLWNKKTLVNDKNKQVRLISTLAL